MSIPPPARERGDDNGRRKRVDFTLNSLECLEREEERRLQNISAHVLDYIFEGSRGRKGGGKKLLYQFSAKKGGASASIAFNVFRKWLKGGDPFSTGRDYCKRGRHVYASISKKTNIERQKIAEWGGAEGDRIL